MAACQSCGSRAKCTCTLKQGLDMTVGGDGSKDSPWSVAIVPTEKRVVFSSFGDMQFFAVGPGLPGDPLQVAGNVVCISCGDPGNVDDVLTRQADGSYIPGPPNQIAPGAVEVGYGLSGQGTAASPLRLNLCSYDELVAACPPEEIP